jgi:cardiolipin synthase
VAIARMRFRDSQAPPRYVDGNRVTLLRDGAEAYPAMLDAIHSAREQVLFEMYWFGSDRAGRRFGDALTEAAARGVEVALLYDAVGSIGSDPAFFEELRRAGCVVTEFGPLAPWRRRFRPVGVVRRDHRKILVVDGEIGFTGGVNIGDPWLPVEEGGAGWRDDIVRVEGPAARGLVTCMLSAWRRAGGPPLSRTRRSDPTPRVDTAGHRVRVLGESYFRTRRQISRAYVAEIEQAKERAWVTNAYFVPDRAVKRALRRAADRGVDVRVLLPGKSDVEIVRVASRATWSALLASGVRLYEYRRRVLHAKSAVIDGRWSTIGTYNLDYQSFRSNLEVNVAVIDEAFGAQMESSYRRDLAESDEVDAREFRNRSYGDRFLEQLAYRFRKVL